MKRLCFVAAALLMALAADAKLKLAEVFTDCMVLQCDKPLCVWGTATPGAEVKVKVGRETGKAVAAADGRWSVRLAPLRASGKAVAFRVSGDGGRIELGDVLVGEVWLASGQSNMEYSMANHPRYAKPRKGDPDRLRHEYEQAGNPMIRLLYVRKDLKSDTLPTAGWQRISRESLKPFSAAAYFFAKALQDSLGVPVGVVSSSWGGTPIETWTPAGAYRESPLFGPAMDCNRLKANGQEVGWRYRKMIEPIAPMSMRGVLWYQGETNLIMGDTDIYTEKMKLLVESWRKAWADSSLPFYYVQISPMLYSGRKADPVAKTWQDLPRFWEAQARCAEEIPLTAMVVTTDIPEDLADIHPPYKWVVGERLARLALNKTYGRTDVVCGGPVAKSLSVEGDSIVVEFEGTAGGLATRDGKAPDWFYALTKKGRYSRVRASLRGNKVYISTDGLARRTEIRFGWDETAQPNLVNSEGLPALPFRRKVSLGR